MRRFVAVALMLAGSLALALPAPVPAQTFSQPLNVATSSLAAAHAPKGTSITVQAGTGKFFGTPSPTSPVRVMLARKSTLANGTTLVPTSTRTIFLATGLSGDTITGLTVATDEGPDNVDQTFVKDDPVYSPTVTKGMLGEITSAISALPVDSSVVHKATVETITGAKTFSSAIAGSITGNAATVTDGVYASTVQTIGGAKTFAATDTNTTPLVIKGAVANPTADLLRVDRPDTLTVARLFAVSDTGTLRVGSAGLSAYTQLDASGANPALTLNRLSTTFNAGTIFSTNGVPAWRIGLIGGDANGNYSIYDAVHGTTGFSLGQTASNPNVSFGTLAPNFQGGAGVLFLTNSTAVPTGDPTGGGFLYSTSGALTWRNPSGVVSTIAPARPDPITILAIGDSITQGQGFSAPGLPAAQVLPTSLSTLQGGRSVTVLNQGHSGSRWADWLPGGTYDVAAVAAGAAAGAHDLQVMLGTNDVYNDDPSSPATILANATTIINAWVGRGYRVVIHWSPWVVPGSNGGRFDAASDTLLQQFQTQLFTLVNGTTVRQGDLDAFVWFRDHLEGSDDGIHPNNVGHAMLGQLWANAWDRVLRGVGTFGTSKIGVGTSQPTTTFQVSQFTDTTPGLMVRGAANNPTADLIQVQRQDEGSIFRVRGEGDSGILRVGVLGLGTYYIELGAPGGNPVFKINRGGIGQDSLTSYQTLGTPTWRTGLVGGDAASPYKIIDQGGTTTVAIAQGGATDFASRVASPSFLRNRRIVTTTTALAATDPTFVAITTIAAPYTVTLPAASSVPAGHTIFAKDETGGAGANTVTFAPAGADTTEAALAISTNYGSLKIYSNGVSKWLIHP